MSISDLRIIGDRPSAFLDLRVVIGMRIIQAYKPRMGVVDDKIKAETL